MLFGFELHVDHVGGSVPPPFYMLENAPQLDVVRSMANTEPCTLYSGRNLQKHRRGQSVLSERCERSAKTPSTSYKNPINPISGRRILWRSPRKKSNTDVSTMFGVAVGQNSLKVHGEFAPQPNSARPKMWDLTRHVSLICSYLFHFISPRCTRHSRSKYFLQKPGNLCSCTFTLSNHGFSELPALYILYMASESNTKLTAPQGLAAGKLKGRPKGATKPESRAHFSKIQGNRSNRYPNILYLSLLVLHHDASFWLIRWVYHRLSVFCCPTIRFFNAELPNNTLMKFASQSLHRVLRIATAIMEIPVQHANFS